MLQVLLDLPPDLPASDGRASDPHLRQRLVDLSELADEDPEHGPTGLAALASGGRLRLLAGMLRANRPWRLATRLYRALIAALATAAFALVTSDVWIIAESLDLGRLALVAALSVGVTVASLIAVHGLWERSGPGTARDQILLFNATTTATVLVGIASLYAVLFVLSLTAAGLLITTDVLSEAVGTSTGWEGYLKLSLAGELAGHGRRERWAPVWRAITRSARRRTRTVRRSSRRGRRRPTGERRKQRSDRSERQAPHRPGEAAELTRSSLPTPPDRLEVARFERK